jgi:hypothetical protein
VSISPSVLCMVLTGCGAVCFALGILAQLLHFSFWYNNTFPPPPLLHDESLPLVPTISWSGRAAPLFTVMWQTWNASLRMAAARNRAKSSNNMQTTTASLHTLKSLHTANKTMPGIPPTPSTVSSSSSSAAAASMRWEALVHPALLTHPNPRRILIVTTQNDDHDDGALCEALKHATVEQVQVVYLTKAIVALNEVVDINVPGDSCFGTRNEPHVHETARSLDQELHRDKQQQNQHPGQDTTANQSCRNDPRVTMTYHHGDHSAWLVVVPTNMDHHPLDVVLVEHLYVSSSSKTWENATCFFVVFTHSRAHTLAYYTLFSPPRCTPTQSVEYCMANGPVSLVLFSGFGQGGHFGWRD